MADAPTLPLDSQLCFSIYSTSIAINRAYKPMLDELGVTYTQYLVLSTLWETRRPDHHRHCRPAGARTEHDHAGGEAAGRRRLPDAPAQHVGRTSGRGPF